MSAPLIAWCGPLPIIGLFLLIGGRWMRFKYHMAISIYPLSMLTGFVATVAQHVTDLGGAIVAGFYAPVGYALLFIALAFLDLATRRLRFTPIRDMAHSPSLRWVMRLSGLAVGAFAGGVAGLAVGGVFFVALPMLTLFLENVPDVVWRESELDLVARTFVYAFGIVGLLVGGAAGWFWFGRQRADKGWISKRN